MRELPGVNDIFVPKYQLNARLIKSVETAKRVKGVDDYISVMSGAKRIEDVEERTQYVMPEKIEEGMDR